MSNLRIMCWNIAEGRHNHNALDSSLPAIAEHIQTHSPDIVLLNEAHNTRRLPLIGPPIWGTGVNQVQRLAELTGLTHCHWGNTAATGITGHKAVGILSRYPLGQPHVHPVMNGTHATGCATLETTVTINDLTHYVFSTRFEPQHHIPGTDTVVPDLLRDNVGGHHQAVDLIRNRPRTAPIIFGGDFNSTVDAQQMVYFKANSGLTDASAAPGASPVETCDGGPEVDYIFFRGPYEVVRFEQRCPWGHAPVSDHPSLIAELRLTESVECVQVRGRMRELRQQITQLQQAKQGLNPRHPADRMEIQEINGLIQPLQREETRLREQANAQVCWL
jgi:endonuclease/exonuclease/phosphatase family metal-dependent hydrolase